MNQSPETRPVGRPVTQPHGTVAAYRRHERHGQTPCPACKAANAAYHRELYRRRNAKEPPDHPPRTRGRSGG